VSYLLYIGGGLFSKKSICLNGIDEKRGGRRGIGVGRGGRGVLCDGWQYCLPYKAYPVRSCG